MRGAFLCGTIKKKLYQCERCVHCEAYQVKSHGFLSDEIKIYFGYVSGEYLNAD